MANNITITTKGGGGFNWSKLILWLLVIVLIVVIIFITWAGLQSDGDNIFESVGIVSDTGDGTGSAWLSAFWHFSPLGLLGGAAGIGTSSTGWSGVGQSWTKGKNSAYTFYKRLFGG